MSDEAAKELARALKKTVLLTELDVSLNNITESGAEAIVKAVAEYKHPIKINLQLNSISDKSKEKLIALSKITSPEGHIQLVF